MASQVGKKYTITFHLMNNDDGPPWTFTPVLDLVDLMGEHTYETTDPNYAGTEYVVVHKYPTSPTFLYRVDNPPGPLYDANTPPKNEMKVVVIYYYTTGSEPPGTTTLDQLLADAVAEAGV